VENHARHRQWDLLCHNRFGLRRTSLLRPVVLVVGYAGLLSYMSSHPPSSSAPNPISVPDEMTEVYAPGSTPKSVFPTSPHALPIGARIGEFEVHRLIGEGGFGVVYLCYDQALDRYVALKEYMPSSLATRQDSTLAIVVKSKHHQETFEAGLKSFINEARLLAQFDHPSLLKVYRFWQANGTAYMTMPYYEGPTLKQALAALSGPPDEALLRSWLLPMLDALEEIHRASCYHRDISPDNILLTNSGPLLLDFGAARRVIGDMTQALTVVLKPGFAPIEQYGDAATMSQGAWTDLYALASVVYFAITGRPPMSAVDRLMDDRLEPLSQRVAGRYSRALLATVDAALSVRPQDRPQSVAAFRAMLSTTPEEQTADLRLWGDDDAPTELFAATVPGVLGGSYDIEPPTVPTGRKKTEPTAPAPSASTPTGKVTLPSAVPAPTPALEAMQLPERALVAMHKRPEVAAVPPTAAPAPSPQETSTPTVLTGKILPDDQPRAQFVPRSPPATAAMGSGAGLAPLSGAVADTVHKVGIPAPLPPRPPVAERTVMPSLLPAVAAPTPEAVSSMAAEKQSASIPAPVANNKQRVNWALWLSLGAFVLAAAAAIWTFTRSEPVSSAPEATAPATPNIAPGPSATGGSPTPEPAVPVTPTPGLAPAAEPVAVQSPAPAPVAGKAAEPLAAERKAAAPSKPGQTQNSSAAPLAENGETNPVSAAPRGAPPIRLGNPSTPRVEADSPIVWTKPTATTAAPSAAPAKVDVAPPTPPVAATPGAGPRSIARCADIRQRASLEDLTPEERQFLRTQCR
jgi:serine/threonine protein kinase